MPKLRHLRPFATLFRITLTFCLITATSVTAQDRPTIVAVNYALSYFAERLAGEDAEVIFPVPDGSDPSFWRPSIAAISTMQQADLILLNGAGFATWTTKASLPRSRIMDTSRGFADSYITTETVTHSHGADGEHSHTGTATYTWLDQTLASAQAEAIATALDARGLVAPDALSARLSALQDELAALDALAKALPDLAAGHTLIATHPRYQYLARAYGLDIRSLEWEAGAAPDDAQISDLKEFVEATGADILIWEAAPPDGARAAVQAIGLTDLVFAPLATRPERVGYAESFEASVRELTEILKSADG